MRLIIPAAGVGVRFAGTGGPLPKCLIPISGRPIISHLFRMASATGLFSQIVIILGPYYETVLETIQGLASSISWTSKTEILCLRNRDFARTNSIYSIYLARDFLEGDVLIHDSDVLVAHPLFETVATKRVPNSAWVLAEKMPSIPEDETKVVTNSDDQVIQIGERDIPSKTAQGRFIGLSHFSSGATELFRDEIMSLVGRGVIGTYYTAAIKLLAEHKMLFTVWSDGRPWFEIDTLDDLRSLDPEAKEQITQQIPHHKNARVRAIIRTLEQDNRSHNEFA